MLIMYYLHIVYIYTHTNEYLIQFQRTLIRSALPNHTLFIYRHMVGLFVTTLDFGGV